MSDKLRLRPRAPSLWHKQPGEPEEAFAAFVSYRNLTPPRELRRVHVNYVTPAQWQLQVWSNAWAWKDRAEAHDAHYDVVGQRAREASTVALFRELAHRHAGALHMAFEIVERELLKKLRTSQLSEGPVLEPHELIRMMKETIELERLTAGKSTANVGVQANAEVAGLSIDHALELDKLLKRAGVGS